MLVRITEKCGMGCNHCLVNAKPDGGHMSMKTYHQTLDFIQWSSIPFIMISGGEPTEHPNIIEMIKIALQQSIKVLMLSNGTFLEKSELKKEIEDLNIQVQITNDKRFYPRNIPIVNNPNFLYIHQLLGISPQGRAVTNELPTDRFSPHCFNLRSITRIFKDFHIALMQMRLSGRMCTPSVNIDGTIVAGESNYCKTFATIMDRKEITDKICSFTCNNCGLMDKLSTKHKEAIGEI